MILCSSGLMVAFSSSATTSAIWLCSSNSSLICRLKLADQIWWSLTASISTRFRRMLSPALSPLPSSTYLTFSSLAISVTGLGWSLYCSTDIRDTTWIPLMFPRWVMISSMVPLMKYISDSPGLSLRKGNTAMEISLAGKRFLNGCDETMMVVMAMRRAAMTTMVIKIPLCT